MLTWIAVRAFLGGAMSALWKWLGARSIAELACIALLLFGAFQTLRLRACEHHAAKVEAQLVKSENARKADRDAYRKAQADAAAKNKAQVAQVEQTYKRNSDDERQSYLNDLAKLRAQRVRPSTPTAPGSTGPARPSPSGPATPGTDGPRVQVPEAADVQEQAAEIELRLMHLQNWVEKQIGVDPNGGK